MMDRAAGVKRLCDGGIVAIVRAQSSEQLNHVVRALADGGVDCIEITMTTPNALDVIANCRKTMGDSAFIGVGSVLNADVCRQAMDAGAQYIVCPIFKKEIIDAAHAQGRPVLPGCLTPTEILTATEAGADLVKVFPAGQFGPGYFKDILAPMPHLRLTPTGGVDLKTASTWIEAGAAALGVGSALVTKSALASGNMAEIRDLAGQYVKIVAEARAKLRK